MNNLIQTFILCLSSDMFADHIGNLTVELVLASAEVKNLKKSFDIFNYLCFS